MKRAIALVVAVLIGGLLLFGYIQDQNKAEAAYKTAMADAVAHPDQYNWLNGQITATSFRDAANVQYTACIVTINVQSSHLNNKKLSTASLPSGKDYVVVVEGENCANFTTGTQAKIVCVISSQVGDNTPTLAWCGKTDK